MKHQYFGDVNDYVKYGLLRVLGAESGVSVGVAWMLTPDDARPDSSRTAYLKDPAWRAHDPDLFDRLARLGAQPGARSLELFRRWELVPGAAEFHAPLPEFEAPRVAWLASALEALAGCGLAFFDPDNGLEVESVPLGGRGCNRYLYWSEAAAAWAAGHSLLVYQHFPREDRDAFVETLRARATAELPGARVTTLRADHALFVLCSRPEHAVALARASNVAAERWAGRVQLASSAPARTDRASDLAAVCEAIAQRGAEAGADELAARWPFVPVPAGERDYSPLQALRVWLRDGFVDRYDGERLVFPGALRLLSLLMPEAFPYHPNWKVDETHPAYWRLHPTVDHVVPVALGGGEDDANRVTTSQLRNSAKAHWTLEQLGWALRPPGLLADWDGLTGWFRGMLAARPELRGNEAIRYWESILDRASPPAQEAPPGP